MKFHRFQPVFVKTITFLIFQFCNNGDFGNCIDLYCMNQKEGRSQREAAREAYLLSLGKARLHGEQNVILVIRICN